MFNNKSKDHFFKALLQVGSVKKTFSLIALAVFAVSCTPSENVLTEEDIKGSSSFDGTVEVQTLSSTQVKVLWTLKVSCIDTESGL